MEGYVNGTPNPVLDVAIDDCIDSSRIWIASIREKPAQTEVRKNGEMVIVCAENDTVEICFYE